MDPEKIDNENELEHSENEENNRDENMNENNEVNSKQNANIDVTESGADIMKKINLKVKNMQKTNLKRRIGRRKI